MKRRTYAGIPQEFAMADRASIILIPVPYDGTSTWQKGADQGPEAFLEASENMELYDIETASEVYRKGIYLADPVTEDRSPEAMVEAVYQVVKDYLVRNKMVTLFGGEHSISIGSIRAFNERFDDLSVLQIDAHADLRESYQGSACNHACALYEASQTANLVQVGIRSMDVTEVGINDEENIFYAHEMAQDDYWMDKTIEALGDNVYITLDLDALDPSIMPSTGTPEPGGLLWHETLGFLKRIFEERTVVGFDIVELCPNKQERSSDFLAAKLYYKMLSYCFAQQENGEEEFEDHSDNDQWN